METSCAPGGVGGDVGTCSSASRARMPPAGSARTVSTCSRSGAAARTASASSRWSTPRTTPGTTSTRARLAADEAHLALAVDGDDRVRDGADRVDRDRERGGLEPVRELPGDDLAGSHPEPE